MTTEQDTKGYSGYQPREGYVPRSGAADWRTKISSVGSTTANTGPVSSAGTVKPAPFSSDYSGGTTAAKQTTSVRKSAPKPAATQPGASVGGMSGEWWKDSQGWRGWENSGGNWGQVTPDMAELWHDQGGWNPNIGEDQYNWIQSMGNMATGTQVNGYYENGGLPVYQSGGTYYDLSGDALGESLGDGYNYHRLSGRPSGGNSGQNRNASNSTTDPWENMSWDDLSRAEWEEWRNSSWTPDYEADGAFEWLAQWAPEDALGYYVDSKGELAYLDDDLSVSNVWGNDFGTWNEESRVIFDDNGTALVGIDEDGNYANHVNNLSGHYYAFNSEPGSDPTDPEGGWTPYNLPEDLQDKGVDDYAKELYKYGMGWAGDIFDDARDLVGEMEYPEWYGDQMYDPSVIARNYAPYMENAAMQKTNTILNRPDVNVQARYNDINGEVAYLGVDNKLYNAAGGHIGSSDAGRLLDLGGNLMGQVQTDGTYVNAWGHPGVVTALDPVTGVPLYSGLNGSDYDALEDALAEPGRIEAENAYTQSLADLENAMGGNGLYGGSVMGNQMSGDLMQGYMDTMAKNAANATAQRYQLQADDVARRNQYNLEGYNASNDAMYNLWSTGYKDAERAQQWQDKNFEWGYKQDEAQRQFINEQLKAAYDHQITANAHDLAMNEQIFNMGLNLAGNDGLNLANSNYNRERSNEDIFLQSGLKALGTGLGGAASDLFSNFFSKN